MQNAEHKIFGALRAEYVAIAYGKLRQNKKANTANENANNNDSIIIANAVPQFSILNLLLKIRNPSP